MIAAELAQRRLVQPKLNFAELFGIGIAGCETLSVNLSQRADESISVFAADFAILVAVAIVETSPADEVTASVKMPSSAPCLPKLHDVGMTPGRAK
jgi:hypothetical protein